MTLHRPLRRAVPRRLARCRALAALLAVMSCGKDSTPPLVATTLATSSASLTLDALGATQGFSVTVRDQNGATMANVTPTVTSSSPGVASVAWGTAGATVTAVTNGTATIAVTAGKASANVSVTVAQVPATLAVFAGNNQSGTVGGALPVSLAARVADAMNSPVAGVSVAFTAAIGSGTIAGSPAITNAQGIATAGAWTLGTSPGVKSAAATVTGLSFAAFNATAVTGPASALTIACGNNQLAAPSAAVAAAPSVKVTDAFGNAVSGAAVAFAVASGGGAITGASATTNSSGVATVGSWTLGAALGANTLTATVVGLPAVTFSATAISSPVIAAITPSLLVPGSAVAISGTGFGATAGSNTVRIGGVAATVTSTSATQLTATVPCMASGAVSVTVTAGGVASNAISAVVAGNVRTLAVGQAYVATSNAASLCNELPAAGGTARYLVSVYSASASANTLVDFELGGNPAIGAAQQAPLAQFAPRRASRAVMAAEDGHSAEDAAHLAHLEHERALGEALRASARSTPSALRSTRTRALVAAPAVGDRRVFSWSWNSCTDTLPKIVARVLYAGTKAVVWEDTSNAILASANATLADRYQRVGQVFDLDQYDAVRTTFGDPLRRDAQTDNDGRVHMIFTHRVNDIGGVAAFVTSADQYPTLNCPTSNVGEFFYGSVPTSTGSNLESSAPPDGWYNFMSRTVVHEVKHIASMTARVENNAPFEVSWLEEGTARVAEEVWARAALHHTAFGANSGYGTAAANGLLCDFNSSNATCLANDPLRRPTWGARRPINEVRPKLIEPWNWSPFADGSGQSGSVFYNTVWALVRYVVDNYGTSDAAFLTALTNSSNTGTTNLATVAGVPFDQLIGGWTLALYADDYPGLTGASNIITYRTWNLRNIYNSLNADPTWASRWNTPYPVVPTALSFGSFTAQQTGVRGAANAYFELSGTMNAAQLLNVRAIGGGTASTLLRIAIARLQ